MIPCYLQTIAAIIIEQTITKETKATHTVTERLQLPLHQDSVLLPFISDIHT